MIGVPDERYGEEVCAWVVLKERADLSEDELKEFCRGKIAHYKVPRHVLVVDEFPMTVTGKIQKFKLRQRAVDQLGLQEAAPTGRSRQRGRRYGGRGCRPRRRDGSPTHT